MKQLRNCKKSMKLLEKEFERFRRYGIRFVTNNIDSHSIEWELIMLINIRVLRLRSTDWKSSLKYCAVSFSDIFWGPKLKSS